MSKQTQLATPELAPLLVDAAAVGRLLSLSRASIFTMHSAGKLPAPVRPTGSDPRWSVAELSRWIEAGCPPRDQWQARKAAR